MKNFGVFQFPWSFSLDINRGVNIPDLSGIPDFGSPEVISLIHPEWKRKYWGKGGYPSSMDGTIKLN